MGLLKFIKKMFSKGKQETTDEKDTFEVSKNNDVSYEKEAGNLNQNTVTNKEFSNNLSKDTYLEKERILELKYLNNKNNITQDNTQTADVEDISIKQLNTIWDILKVKENTQAEHIITSIPSDKWITMDEIRHNIKLNFNVEYSNEKSLYPYLKTLTDINLIKLNNTGKKRTWKKNVIFIKEN